MNSQEITEFRRRVIENLRRRLDHCAVLAAFAFILLAIVGLLP